MEITMQLKEFKFGIDEVLLQGAKKSEDAGPS
jgi:coenzyme F420-reducing hydrogenase delta subunit